MPKLSEKLASATDNPEDGYLHIIKPDGLGGYTSFPISYDNFIASLIEKIEVLEEKVGVQTELFYVDEDVSTYLSDDISKLMSIDINRISGDATYKIGTSEGGGDIIPEITVSSGTESITINKVMPNETTLWITRISGVANIFINYSKQWLRI